MSSLRAPLREVLREQALDDDELQRRSARVVAKLEVRRLTRAWSSAAAACVVVVAVTVAFVLLARKHHDAGPLILASPGAVTDLESSASSPRTLGFSDGSFVTLAPATALDLLENNGQRFDVRLRGGRATFDVKPGGPRRWIVECGATIVEVVGTHFEVEREHGWIGVEVSRGAVLVRGPSVPNHVTRLGPTDRLSIPDELGASSVDTAPRVTPPVPSRMPEEALPKVQRARPSARPAAPSASWRALAEAHRFVEAWSLARTAAVRGTAPENVDDLFALADVARYAGDREAALQLLERIGRVAPSDIRAGIAAFMRGRILSDDLHAPSRASRSFAESLVLGLPESLEEDAYARLVEAHAAAGDMNAARAAARQYQERFPSGHLRGRIARVVAP